MNKEINRPWRKSRVITAVSFLSVAVLTFMTLFIYYAVTNFHYNYPTITFDADGGTLELYDSDQVKFPITKGEDTWKTFYPKHNYFGATKEGYDFLCWSVDGDYPVDNNYYFDKSITLKPIYVKNRDCLTVSCRYLDDDSANECTIAFDFDGPPPFTVKCAINGGDFEDYTRNTDLSDKLTGAGDYFSFKISDGIPDIKHFNIFADNKTRFAVSGPIDALTNKQDYPDNAFAGLFSDNAGYPPNNNAICSARGLDLSGHQASNNCFRRMFAFIGDGSKLVCAPLELPATIMGESCYAEMFGLCSSLIQGPNIIAGEQVSKDACRRMFEGCGNLMKGPEICATEIGEDCFEGMFCGCGLINSIKIHYEGNFVGNSFGNWTSGVASAGTFYYNGNDTARGTSAIPENWTIQKF